MTPLDNYASPAVVADYARADTISDCEKLLFDTYVPRGGAVLDLGVGGGRTTAYLASGAGQYLGVDFSPNMIAACRERFPDVPFLVADASRLDGISDRSFDSVVFSFNGIDCFTSDRERAACIAETERVLKPGGTFIFSSHNARLLAPWPALANARFHQIVWRFARMAVAAARSAASPSFRRGEGYAFEHFDGGMLWYRSTPGAIRRQVEAAGLHLEAVHLAQSPRIRSQFFTHWIYYVGRKPG